MCAGLVALGAAAEPRLEHIGTFVWDRPESYFGGWSGIEVRNGGVSFVAIGDSAQLYDGKFERRDGAITDVVWQPVGALGDLDGAAIFGKGDPLLGDSEGLALLESGGFAVSFERKHRIVIYRDDALPVLVPLPRDVFSTALNGGAEALARDPDGRLVAIPETLPEGAVGYPVWRQSGDGWEVAHTLPRTQGYAPVGADFGDDGRLFVLERAFRGLGFQNRLRVVSLEDRSDAVIWSTRLREFDNLEGLSVWRGTDDDLRLTMISDDNYRRFQRTEIVEFRLTE